jgi:hypothetical protein
MPICPAPEIIFALLAVGYAGKQPQSITGTGWLKIQNNF